MFSLEAKEGGTVFSGLFLLTSHKILYGQEAVVLEMSVLTLIHKPLIHLLRNCFLNSFLKCKAGVFCMYLRVGTCLSLLVSQLNFCSKWVDRGECESSAQQGTHTLLYFQMQLTVIVEGLHCSLQRIWSVQEKGHVLSNQEKSSMCSGKSDMRTSVAHPGFARK